MICLCATAGSLSVRQRTDRAQFCDIRYCIVRHLGFLIGEGRPAGDACVRPESIEQAIALLSRPVPDASQLEHSLVLLKRLASPVGIPEPEAELEGALFDVLTILFIRPRDADRASFAIAHAVGESTFEILIDFLAFVRTAHYWTETHPTLGYESDMVALMREHPGACAPHARFIGSPVGAFG